jgi:hypothetical protein
LYLHGVVLISGSFFTSSSFTSNQSDHRFFASRTVFTSTGITSSIPTSHQSYLIPSPSNDIDFGIERMTRCLVLSIRAGLKGHNQRRAPGSDGKHQQIIAISFELELLQLYISLVISFNRQIVTGLSYLLDSLGMNDSTSIRSASHHAGIISPPF